MRIQNSKERTAPKKSVSKVMENKTIEDYSLLYEQEKKRNKETNHSLPPSIYFTSQMDSYANGKRKHFKKDSGAKAEKTLLTDGLLHKNGLSKIDNNRSNDRRLRLEYMENHASDAENGVNAGIDNSVTSETSATGNKLSHSRLFFSPEVKLHNVLQSTANLKNDLKRDEIGESSRENIKKHEQDRKGNVRVKYSLPASIYLSPEKDSCANGKRKHSQSVDICLDMMQMDASSKKDSGAKIEKTSVSNGFLHDSDLSENDDELSNDRRLCFEVMENHASENVENAIIDTGSSSVTSETTSATGKVKLHDVSTANFEKDSKNDSKKDENGETSREKITKHEQYKKGNVRAKYSLPASIYLSPEKDSCASSTISSQSRETDLIKDANTKTSRKKRSKKDIHQNNERSVEKRKTQSQTKSASSLKELSSSHNSKDKGKVFQSSLFKFGFGSTTKNKNKDTLNSLATMILLKPKLEPPNDSFLALKDEIIYISTDDEDEKDCKKTTTTTTTSVRKNLFLSEEIDLCDEEDIVLEVEEEKTESTVSNDSVSISSNESPIVPIQHTSQRDSTSRGGKAIRKSSEKDDKLKASSVSVRLDRLGEANSKDDNIDNSDAKAWGTPDLLPHVVWPLSFSFNWDLSNTSEPPFLPSIISQCMESSRENGFYSTALDHGRPTLARKPTAELLGQFVKMLMSDNTTVMNEAFSDLMSWAENHPPLAPSMVKVYSDLFEITTGQEFLSSLLQKLTEISVCDGTDLLLEFTVAVLEMNFSSCLRLQDKKSVKDCLLIKWLWTHYRAIHHNSKTKELLRVFESILTRPEASSSVRHSISTLISLVAECLRLVSVQWSTQNRNYRSDRVTSFASDTARVIREVCPKEKPFSMVSYLLSFKPVWFRTLITASLLSFSNDYLLQQSVEVHDISLRAIVSQYFFLLPPLSNQSDWTHRSSEISTSPQSKNTELSTFSEKKMLHLKDLPVAKVNKRNGKGESAVHTAAIKGDVITLKKLLKDPSVDVNLKDNNGWTPLHEACNHGQYDCVEVLLKYVPPKTVECFFQKKDSASSKVDINAAGHLEITPLHDAVLTNRVEICRLLLRYGGKRLLETKTVKGYTALDLAQTEEMMNVLNSVWYTGSCNNSLDLSQDTQSEESLSLSQSELINSTTYFPSRSRYFEVLQQGTDLCTANYLNCSLFLSLISLLLTSYVESNTVQVDETIKLNLMCKDDKVILCRMKTYLKLLRKHLRKITANDTFESLQSELLILAVAVSAN